MTMRIATFNLKDFFAPKTDVERAVAPIKLENVARDVLRADADVVALQEVGETEHLEAFLASHLAKAGYGAPVFGTADKRGIRCAILSRLPILWSQVHAAATLPFPRFFEADPEPFGARIPLRRGIPHVRVDGGSLGEVDILTAHFKSNLGAPMKRADGTEIDDPTPLGRAEASMRSLVQRAAEALFVRRVVDDVLAKSPDHAICVLGDLNDRAESLPVSIVRGIGEPAGGTLRGCAELVEEARRFSCLHGGGPSLIDHVLVTERLRAALQRFEIFNEALRYHGPYVENAPPTPDSDHALCVATFG